LSCNRKPNSISGKNVGGEAVRITGFKTLRDWTCFDADSGKDLAVEVREYFMPDFSNWKVLADGHHAAFESAFARWKKDLEAENSRKQ
jgi:hypothetical protein